MEHHEITNDLTDSLVRTLIAFEKKIKDRPRHETRRQYIIQSLRKAYLKRLRSKRAASRKRVVTIKDSGKRKRVNDHIDKLTREAVFEMDRLVNEEIIKPTVEQLINELSM